jgi:hypothetical protein
MKQQLIYEVSLITTGSLNELRNRPPTVVYFSNLKKTLELVAAELILNGWPVPFNYSAVYRSLKIRNKYHCDFDVVGNRVFRLSICTKTLNPVLPLLGIEEKPHA